MAFNPSQEEAYMRVLQTLARAALFASLIVPATVFGAPQDPDTFVLERRVAPPVGYMQFCRDYPQKCTASVSVTVEITLTKSKLDELRKMNTAVNKRIRRVEDKDHWPNATHPYIYTVNGQRAVEKWDLAEDRKGDCEEFALVKREELLVAGWPRSALLIATAYRLTWVKNGTEWLPHVVLIVRTKDGDYVLDFDHDEPALPKDTKLRFWKVQSPNWDFYWYDVSSAQASGK